MSGLFSGVTILGLLKNIEKWEQGENLAQMIENRFFACCDAHGLNPTEWLTQSINRIADTKMSELESLLPRSAPAQ